MKFLKKSMTISPKRREEKKSNNQLKISQEQLLEEYLQTFANCYEKLLNDRDVTSIARIAVREHRQKTFATLNRFWLLRGGGEENCAECPTFWRTID